MNIYLLTGNDFKGYDTNRGFVIVAENSNAVRDLASRSAADEGADIWLSLEKSSCVKIGEGPGPERIVSIDFMAG